jgi:hypothetical protein
MFSETLHHQPAALSSTSPERPLTQSSAHALLPTPLSPTFNLPPSLMLTFSDRVRTEQQRMIASMSCLVSSHFDRFLQESLQLMHSECAVMQGACAPRE